MLGEMRIFCRFCPSKCPLDAEVKGGRIVSVKACEDDPLKRGKPCPKGLSIPDVLYHPSRLRKPLLKDKGKFREVSWEDALSFAAERIDDIRRRYGSRSVALSLGDPRGLELAFSQRFASAFGTPNIATPGHVCHMPTELASIYTFGSSVYPDRDETPGCIILWGCAIAKTRGIGLSLPWLVSSIGKADLIVIDPTFNEFGRRARIWLKPKPGSDCALALGFLKVMVEEGFYDREFVDKWTVGFEKLVEHLSEISFEDIERWTWVGRGDIREAVRIYMEKRPSCIVTGNGIEATINGFQTLRAIAIIKAISGNLDVPGGEVFRGELSILRPGRFMLLREFPRKDSVGDDFSLSSRSAFIPRQSLIRAIIYEKPYPIKALLCIGSNPLLTFPDSGKVYEALKKLEFILVSDLFMTPTGELSDVVLPASSVGEFEEILPYPPVSDYIFFQPKIVEPPGDSWSDMKIINELAKKLGLSEYFFEDEREALDLILEPSGMKFEDALKEGYMVGKKGYRRYEKGVRTPSGKVEIYSSRLEELGMPLPSYRDIEDPEYPLYLTNYKSLFFVHSSMRVVEGLKKKSPEPCVEMNPKTMEELGVREGEWVFIETRRGKIKQKAKANPDIPSRVVVASYGWWSPGDWEGSNINVLTGMEPEEPFIGTVQLKGVPCRLTKA